MPIVVAGAIALLGCTTALPKEPVVATTTTTAADVPAAEVTADPVAVAAEPDYTAQATANATLVLEGIHDDLLACYKKRVAMNPNAHGSVIVDIVIDPRGQVRSIETTGGAGLGDETMTCIAQRIKRATFEPPHDGGTLRVEVPFSLGRVLPGEDP